MADLKLVPVPTRILTNKDNIVDAIMEYAGHDITNHDIVCAAESVVAITQGRYIRPEELHICWQARLMNRFVPGAGSMASIYGMQAAMEEEGKWNMLFFFHNRRCGKNIWQGRRVLRPMPPGIFD